ncbi:hypothetical protein LPJ73_002323 [Coemansia sp. RSA 2703]|nr:hypothetical protein LPJ73_002323 [Coemansia sp. RSA 2703]KAJ2366348.1 hypothetical protein IW150_005964 [Coemansia sp. RSA 2607]KAJ2389023.1 hypothetical protein GGI05_003621 [Coemansia sp. RSA 2603]
MFYKSATILVIAALASVGSVSAAPQDMNDILAQASNLLTGDLSDIIAQASDLIGTQLGDVTSLLNDPAFISSAEAAMNSLGGFLSENPGILSSLAEDLSLPTIAAPDVDNDSTDVAIVTAIENDSDNNTDGDNNNTDGDNNNNTDGDNNNTDGDNASSVSNNSSSGLTSNGSFDANSIGNESGLAGGDESSSSGAAGLKPFAGAIAAAGLVVYAALF